MQDSTLEGTIIGREIRRTNRNLLILNGLALALALALMTTASRSLSNRIVGPYEQSLETIASVTDPSTPDEFFVEVTGNELLASGDEVREVDKHIERGRRRGANSSPSAASDRGRALIDGCS